MPGFVVPGVVVPGDVFTPPPVLSCWSGLVVLPGVVVPVPGEPPAPAPPAPPAPPPCAPAAAETSMAATSMAYRFSWLFMGHLLNPLYARRRCRRMQSKVTLSLTRQCTQSAP